MALHTHSHWVFSSITSGLQLLLVRKSLSSVLCEYILSEAQQCKSLLAFSDESQITKVHAGGADDVDLAVKAARAALKGPWASVSGTDRGKLMLKLADLAEQHTKTFASIDTWNNGMLNPPTPTLLTKRRLNVVGKRFSSACGDVGELTEVLRYYAGFADKLHGQGMATFGSTRFATNNLKSLTPRRRSSRILLESPWEFAVKSFRGTIPWGWLDGKSPPHSLLEIPLF